MQDEAIIIPILALMIPIVVAPTALLIKHLRNSREMLHAERMRAIERGQPFATASFWPSLAAIAIGGVVPVGCFGVAWLSNLTGAAGTEAFVGATILGIVAVVTGARLATKLATASSAPKHDDTHYSTHDGYKTAFEPDALDVVSRRG